MVRMKRLLLAFALALGLAATAVNYLPLEAGAQIAGSKGDKAGAGRDPSLLGATPDELQVASSKGGRADAARESS